MSYARSSTGVTVDLATGDGTGGDAAGDRVFAFENIIGSDHDDLLIGNRFANIFHSGLGADTMRGGTGRDTIDYSDGAAVAVSLVAGTFGLGAAGDIAGSIESVVGSNAGGDLIFGSLFANRLEGGGGNDRLNALRGADVLVGGDGRDRLSGNAGADRLEGGISADRLDGGSGNDLMAGGLGADLFRFGAANFGNDRIEDFADGTDRLRFGPSVADGFDDFVIVGNGTTSVTVGVAGNAGHSIVLAGSAAITLTAADFVLFT